MEAGISSDLKHEKFVAGLAGLTLLGRGRSGYETSKKCVILLKSIENN